MEDLKITYTDYSHTLFITIECDDDELRENPPATLARMLAFVARDCEVNNDKLMEEIKYYLYE